MNKVSLQEQAVRTLGSVMDFFDRAVDEHSIPTLQKECWQISEDHGFHNVGQSVGDKLMLIVSEAAEALEDHRDGHECDEVWFKDGHKPCGIPTEVADIVIRCLDFAECYGFDLDGAIKQKMEFNRGRPHLHGRTM